MGNQLLLKELKVAYENRNQTANQPENTKVIFILFIYPMQEPIDYTESVDEPSARKKHVRRTAKEINKNETCPYKSCGK